MTKSNILFIINPISGGKNKQRIPALIDAELDRNLFNPNFSFTEYVGHAGEIADEAAQKNFDVIVAVGGDGTINEVASKVLEHGKILGIIPLGSGNGLARFLNIPMNTRKAVHLINQFHVDTIDTGRLNNQFFFNMAGMGFDAHVSSVFAGNKSRGFSTYLQLGLREMINYQPETYSLYIDGLLYTRTAYVVSIANSSQYGNNAHVSPRASVKDGLLDVCIIKQFPLYKIPVLAYHMLNASADRSGMVEIIKGRKISVVRQADAPIHLDGEPVLMSAELNIEVQPLSLQVIVPEDKALI